jgi:hypothetical protein
VALQLDIKANDAFERSALAAADALDRVASREREVDVGAAKVASAYKAAASQALKLSKATLDVDVYRGDAKGAGSNAADYAAKKAAELEKKKSKEGEKFSKKIKEAVGSVKTIATTLAAAAASIAAMGIGMAALAKNAGDTRKESAALVDAFTGQQGPKVLKQLDNLAVKLGASIDETRAKFVEFRQAGFNSQQSASLIKMRADLKAVGLSAEAADKEIGYVTAKADGFGNVAAMMQLAEISKAYRGIGSGAAAAAKAGTTVESAWNKISNVSSTALAKLWEKIGPDIGKAANRLADFVEKLITSDAGKKALDDVAAGFKKLTDAVNDKSMREALVTLKDMVTTTAMVARGLKFIFSGGLGDGAADYLNKLKDYEAELKSRATIMGAEVTRGVSDGIRKADGAASEAVRGLGDTIKKQFTGDLKIQSPSKVFEQYGRNTVEGYEIGQRKAIGDMPLQSAAAAAPQGRQGGGATKFEINVNVTGGADAEEIGKAVRQQIQLLLQAGALSRGLT